MNTQTLTPDPDLTLEQRRWQAVLARDEQLAGCFYYAVRSTGIYCRPDCPSRRPRRDQVLFFASHEAAAAAGFRPCKRCQPEQDRSPQTELVARAIAQIENATAAPTLAGLGAALGVSPFHLQRVFKRATGLTPRQYAAGLRAGRFKAALRGGAEITGALYEAGYGSASRLYEESDQRLGMTPTVYRGGGNEMQIQYTMVDCPLGRMLVAATQRGVCAVSLGADDAALLAQLRAEYPAAALTPAQGALAVEVRALLAHLGGQLPRLDLALDVQATAFQLRVWEELRRIPYGETRTYTEVAAAIGRPRAVRAVASACARNPAALVTPCQRVIRGDGGLGGYRWGLERKEALLAGERERSKPGA